MLSSKVVRSITGITLSGVALAIALAFSVPALGTLSSLSEKGSLSRPLKLNLVAAPSVIYASNGSRLYTFGSGQFVEPVSLSQVPKMVQNAVLDVEDHAFYIHGALDLKSIARAVIADSSGNQGLQGGSTITQQLVKNTILTPQRTISRKIHEAFLSYRLFGQLSRKQILQDYLNTIYFGEGAYGIQAASKTYFNKPVSQIDPAQAALLAVLIEDPSGLNPIFHPRSSLFRRNLALKQMQTYGDLTASQAATYSSEPLPKQVFRPADVSPSGFAGEVVYRLLHLSKYSFLGATPNQRLAALDSGGYKIYTGLDPTMQSYAEQAVSLRSPNTGGKVTAALVSVDPHTGIIKAFVSGNPLHGVGGYDVVTGRGGTGRQPGSTFKLFTLMSALQQGYSPNDTIDGTAPCKFVIPGVTQGTYVAHNAEPGLGVVSINKATALSINCAYIRLGVKLGLNNVVNMAHLLGVHEYIPAIPSMVIGSVDVTPLEMAGAYATIADLGVYHKPVFVTKILSSRRKPLYSASDQGVRVLPQNLCEVAIGVLKQVIQYGTGTGAAIGRPAAGKTGTTDNFTDGWFDGFTPQLATSVWMGDPSGAIPMAPPLTPVAVYGGTYPASIWQYFMYHSLSGYSALNFPPPPVGSIAPGKFLVPVDSPGSIMSTTTTTSSTTTTTPTSATSQSQTTTQSQTSTSSQPAPAPSPPASPPGGG